MKYIFKVFSFLCSVLVIGYWLLPIVPASAHPQPLAVQEFLFNYSAESLSFTYKLRMDSLVVKDVYPFLDTDNSGDVSNTEMQTYINDKVLGKIVGRLNNRDLKFELAGNVKTLKKAEITSLDDYFEMQFVAIDPVIKETNSLYFKSDNKFFPNDPYGDFSNFEDNLYGNTEVQNLSKDNFTPIGIGEYSVDFKILNFEEQSSAQKPEATQSKKSAFDELLSDLKNSSSDLANQAKKVDYSNPLLVLSALGILFVAGALHALTPGHGKSMLAAFLIGKKKSKVKDVLILAGSITLAHTAVIYILGFVLLALNQTAASQTVTIWIERASAWLMIILASVLIYRGYNSWRHIRQHQLEHEHEHDHNHPHEHEPHHHHGHTHANEKMTIKNDWDLFYAGISGGIVPCLDALSILLLFVSLKQVGIGLLFVFVFSLGLAAAVIALGLALLYGKDKFNLEEKLGEKAEYIMPVISGGIILVISIIYLFTK